MSESELPSSSNPKPMLNKNKRSTSGFRIWKEDTDELEAKFFDALYQGNTQVVEECINLGVDPNVTDDDDMTPLHHTAICGDTPMGKILMSSVKIDINKTDPDGNTALMFACIYRHEDFVKELLNKGAEPEIVNMKGQRALHMACTGNSLKISNHLIANGANINVLDAFDNTPLSIAVIDHGSIPLSVMLLKKGANATSTKKFPLFLECVLNCNTMARLKLIKILLCYGVDIYCVHPISKRNCLHFVAITGYLPAAKSLLKRGESNLYSTDLAGRTPLRIAWDHRNFEIYNHYIDWFEKDELRATLEDDIIEHLYKIFDQKNE
ncbi:serine/threonine-protein phosphatase 6 regulatory ankyrin repeat subunit C-like [Anoplophora glabripennis]|uniref:serine/threonine-protein phosphatase 6 regulatory ankyrin repeat subunit C-like n=1 Tax=Anoplophora glabripennis TaxID=217634 RepID=UPI0008748448|nr:serine/threonine-protein phosphatase 6 regulatory ankyrin repeat subunit C-like [Anoplophora glabripennis]